MEPVIPFIKMIVGGLFGVSLGICGFSLKQPGFWVLIILFLIYGAL